MFDAALARLAVRHALRAARARMAAARPRWQAVLPGLVVLCLGGCAISTPFPRVATDGPHTPDDKVVLVLTRIVVDTSRRAEFDRQTRQVIESLPAQPGLIGFAARRQLIGNEAWTMSVWESDEARARFVASAVHRQAIARSAPAIVRVELKRLTLPRKEVPADWPAALAMLAEPGGARTYGP